VLTERSLRVMNARPSLIKTIIVPLRTIEVPPPRTFEVPTTNDHWLVVLCWKVYPTPSACMSDSTSNDQKSYAKRLPNPKLYTRVLASLDKHSLMDRSVDPYQLRFFSYTYPHPHPFHLISAHFFSLILEWEWESVLERDRMSFLGSWSSKEVTFLT